MQNSFLMKLLAKDNFDTKRLRADPTQKDILGGHDIEVQVLPLN